MGTIDTLLKVRADATQAVRGLKPLQTSLEETAKDAQTTEAALAGLDGTYNVYVNDSDVEAARKEIERLRNMMREQLRANVEADTSDAEKRIKQLQKTIKVLDAQHPTVEVAVTADTTGLSVGLDAIERFGDAGGGLPGTLAAVRVGLGGLGATAAAAATGIGAGATAIWGLGQMAADVETQISQLDALTQGLGEETFADLQEFAKTTPFELDEVTAATKRLVAAGVPLEELPDMLHDLGNVAAATGVPIEQISTVFAQMVSKGKASYEELQQLAEQGIPVWNVLADKLGLTVAEVQKLATEGKLGADAIELVSESLNQMYPTAMQDQAETFNGQMSTLKDTLSQIGQTVGAVFLPAMKDIIGFLGDVGDAALWAAEKLRDYDNWLRETTSGGKPEGGGGMGLADSLKAGLGFGVGSFEDFKGEAEDTEESTGSLNSALEVTTGLAAKVKAGFFDADVAAQAFAESVQAAEEAVKAAADAFAGIGGDIRTTVDFVISQDDLEEEIRDTLKGVEDMPPVELPANLTLGGLAGLGDQQQELVGMVSEFVQTGLTEGARRAEIVPGFDEDAWYAQVRKDTRGLLIDAGINPKNANKVLGEVFGLPRKVPTGADVSGAKDDLAALNGTEITVIPKPPKSLRRPESPLDPFKSINIPAPEPVPAPIVPEVDQGGVKDTNAAIGNVAKPNGSARVAPVKVKIDPVSLMNAFFTLAALTATQTKTIKIHFEENPTGDPINPATVQGLLGATRAMTVTAPAAAGPTAAAQQPRQLAPRQTPVQVLLDGAVIADHMELKAGRLAAAGSVRRNA